MLDSKEQSTREIQVFGDDSDTLQSQTIKSQLRDLSNRIASQQKTIDVLTAPTQPDAASTVVPPLINLADNTDFIYAEESYNSTTFTDDEDVLANWYQRTQATVSSYILNTTSTESAESIRRSVHAGGLRTGAKWDDATGSVMLTGGYKLATPLNQKHAIAGSYFIVKFQIYRPTGSTTPPTGMKCKVTLWDNTANKILSGTKPSLILTKSTSPAHSGVVTREYILEVVMPDGKKFYSDITTPANVTNTDSPVDVSDRYVDISWSAVTGARRYNVFRRATSGSDTNWYLAESVTNGGTSAIDFGGKGGGQWSVPSLDETHKEFQLAEGFMDDIGKLLQFENDISEVVISLRVPSTFTPNGEQYLQIEFLKEDFTATTTTEISSYGLVLDRVGLSTTSGRWFPSSRDLTRTTSTGASIPPTGTPNPPPQPPPPDDEPENPPDGGGGPTCVEENQRVLWWDDDGRHKWMPAKEVIIGDRLVSWDGEKLAPTLVKNVIHGISRTNYIIHTADYELNCTFSHRLIKDMSNFEKGTVVKFITDSTLCFKNGNLEVQEVVAVETINAFFKVITFTLESGKNNYIAEGFVSHNLKPLPDP